jgi:Flp pilus assembly protein TadG
MIKRLIKGFAWAKRLKDERGNALVELAACLPMLLVLVFGLIDFSQMIFDKQAMSGISRQGSNIASRTYRGDTTSLQTTVAGLVTQGASLNIATNGRIIVTVVANNVSGNPQIIDQAISPTGISASSAVGSGIGNPATVPSNATPVLSAGQTLYVTEVFYTYSPLTPVGNFIKKSLASTMYEVAYF